MSDLKQAAVAALDVLEEVMLYICTEGSDDEIEKSYSALEGLRAALKQEEPVAWRTFDGEGGYDYRGY